VINQLFAKGSVSIQPIGPVVDGQLTSSSGNLAGVPYQNLDLNASLEGKRARVISLKIKAFSGDVVSTADVRFEPGAPFNASISFTNLDVQQMLDAQKAKAAGIVRGTLGGNMNVAAKLGTFDEMKPTMKGNGKLVLTNGKLIGVNIGGEALKKVQNLPAIGDLVPMAVVKNHPELFSNPDTDIQIASLTYVLEGPRITSHDIKVQTVDYNLLGDGWFDIDKNVDLAARIVLAPAFSKELIEQKQQVAYIADRDGQISIPLQISGQLPKPTILPNVTELAQRAATHAAQAQGQKYIGKFLGKKGLPGGLGKFLGADSGGAGDSGSGASDGSGGGSSTGGAPPSGGSKPPPNPLDQLKKLF
jgi:AsmA-like protein